MQPENYFFEIMSLTGEIGQLEGERDGLRRELDKAMVFSYQFDAGLRETWRKENENKVLRYEELNREIDSKRQKLISLELGSIAASSQQFNQNIGKMNDSLRRSITDLNDSIGSLKTITDNSMKSLNGTVQRLLSSSTTLEILSSAVIIGATVSITLAVLTLNAAYAVLGLVLVVTEGYWLILLPIIRRIGAFRKRKTRAGS